MTMPDFLARRAAGAVLFASAASTALAAAPTATRPAWVSSTLWYDVDPATWTQADVARIERGASAGDAQALYLLGVMHEEGSQRPRDLQAAFRHYERAATQGNASAQASLARMYVSGWGTAKDLGKAIEWNARAAAQQQRRALYNQGLFARRNQISPGGDAVALPYFEQAAKLGLSQGALEMARHHRKTSDTSAEAWQWLAQARKDGFAPALLEFDEWCNKTPDGPDCVAQAGRAMADAAAAGYVTAQRQFGVRLWEPHTPSVAWNDTLRRRFIDEDLDTPGLSANRPEGARWLTRAAQAGDGQALFNVGLLLAEQNERAKYFKPDYEVAPIGTVRTCYHHAAVAGVPDAMVALVMTLRVPAEKDPLSDTERMALATYWTGKAGETGVFTRNTIWAVNFPGWQDAVGTPAPAFLTRGLGSPATCALVPLPGASKD